MRIARVFVDTGAWAAVQLVDDEHHVDAARTLQSLLARPSVLITTNHDAHFATAGFLRVALDAGVDDLV